MRSHSCEVNAVSNGLMAEPVNRPHLALVHSLRPACNAAYVATGELDSCLVDIVLGLASVVHIDFDLEREMHLELDHSLYNSGKRAHYY